MQTRSVLRSYTVI